MVVTGMGVKSVRILIRESIVTHKKRIDLFKKYGYDTLVIWEHELKDLEKLKKRVLEFSS